MPSEARLERIRQVLHRRLGHVCCAVEALRHRHNVSAILRTCDALGIHRVHLIAGEKRLVKGAARGAERWLEIHRHKTVAEAIESIREQGFKIWAADFADPPTPPEEVPVDQPVCIWFGSELIGVDPEVRNQADGLVTIPMRGFAQSLNVSVAAALTLRPVAERARVQGRVVLLSDAAREHTLAKWVRREDTMKQGMKARGRVAVQLPDPT